MKIKGVFWNLWSTYAVYYFGRVASTASTTEIKFGNIESKFGYQEDAERVLSERPSYPHSVKNKVFTESPKAQFRCLNMPDQVYFPIELICLDSWR